MYKKLLHQMATAKRVQNVLLLGGTHGNEMSGVYVAKQFLKNPAQITKDSFKTTVLMGNPMAVEKCTRYIDVDLNRQFTKENLNGTNPKTNYEVKRVREMWETLSTHSTNPDVVLDMHNTTANMGNCFIIKNQNQIFDLHLINYVVKKATFSAPAHILCISSPNHAYSCSRDIAPNGLALELGPQPQGVLLAEMYQRMQELVINSMIFIEDFNSGVISDSFQTDAYNITDKVDFPRDADGNITAMIHPRLQDRDWEAVNKGDPLFLTFDGKTITYDKQETRYPVFINEASYYEKNLAFWLTRKETLNIPSLKME
ncbi:N-acyl-aromatic-L-amino acid amidohydrolase (carboxylate-forming)-like [Antedon mediterranea]|uniref:N-acyl-aromatic-L-amino acid amidohydrolase (carboxylate-forming)-like n=1 Tax=Antedon mediterranea TaxID=105859 RepID=UPI003AF646C3